MPVMVTKMTEVRVTRLIMALMIWMMMMMATVMILMTCSLLQTQSQQPTLSLRDIAGKMRVTYPR